MVGLEFYSFPNLGFDPPLADFRVYEINYLQNKKNIINKKAKKLTQNMIIEDEKIPTPKR